MMDVIDNSWQEGELGYRAFLLRCWQEEDLENGGEPDESLVWRFALVQINGRSRAKGFASLEELVDHLRGQLSQATAGNETPSGSSVHQRKNSTEEIFE